MLLIGIFWIGGILNAYASSVSIDEFWEDGAGFFRVTNTGGSDVYAFAVANSSLMPAGYEAVWVDDSWSWAAAVISKETWDSGYNIGYDGEDSGEWFYAVTSDTVQYGSEWYINGDKVTSPSSDSDQWPRNTLWSTLPVFDDKFDTYFGDGYDRAVIYYTSIEADGIVTNNPIENGETIEFGFSADEPGSPFIAFGQDSGIIAQGEAAVVPVPGSVFLLACGLTSLAGLRRKKFNIKDG